MPVKICIAANEDGFGPSAFAYYLIQALLEAWQREGRNSRLQVLLLNQRAYALNQALHARHTQVRLIRLDSYIRLERREGEVCVPQTLRALKDYVQHRERYYQEANRYLRGCALSIDIGVPLLARAAHRLGVPNVTVFDHSWARTLRGVVREKRSIVVSLRPRKPTGLLSGSSHQRSSRTRNARTKCSSSIDT